MNQNVDWRVALLAIGAVLLVLVALYFRGSLSGKAQGQISPQFLKLSPAEQRAALAKHVFALGKFFPKTNWPDLSTRKRNIRNLFGHPDPAAQTSSLGDGKVARYAVDLGII